MPILVFAMVNQNNTEKNILTLTMGGGGRMLKHLEIKRKNFYNKIQL